MPRWRQAPLTYGVSLGCGIASGMINAFHGNPQGALWAFVATAMLLLWITEKE